MTRNEGEQKRYETEPKVRTREGKEKNDSLFKLFLLPSNVSIPEPFVILIYFPPLKRLERENRKAKEDRCCILFLPVTKVILY